MLTSWLSALLPTLRRAWGWALPLLKKIPLAGYLALAIVLLLALLYREHQQVVMAQDQVAVLNQNLKAAKDTTRQIKTTYGLVETRLQEQVAKVTLLDAALKAAAAKQHVTPISAGGITATTTPESLTTTTTVTHTDTLPAAVDTLLASLELTLPPVLGHIGVRIVGASAAWEVQLKPAPVHIDYTLGCGPNGPQLLLHGPDWLTLDIGAATTATTVCHPKRGRSTLGALGVGAAIGAVLVLLVR